jgi:DNA mismatch repair protein MutH
VSPSQISIFNEIASNINYKYLTELINLKNTCEINKSNIPNIVKNYIFSVTMFDQNVLEKYNIKIKIVPVNSSYKCYEAISFPHTSLKDLIFEKWNDFDTWEEAQLRKNLSSIYLFVPIIKHKEKGVYNCFENWYIGEICVWKVGDQELKLIGEEWGIAKAIIEGGVKLTKEKFGKGYRMKNNLLKQSDTNYIHIRPHGINSFDIDKPYFQYTNNTIEITKQSFWLNKKFINNLLKRYRWIMNSKEE